MLGMNQTFLSQAPQIIPVITDDRDFYINLVLAATTFLAVLVALLQEPIKKFLSRAKIKVEIKKLPPDCHQILLTNQQTGEPMGYTIYSRIRITNESTINTASNVEVFISHFWKIDKRGKREEIQTFLPMNLKWSHTHEIRTPVLPAFYRYCDFGSFRKTNNNSVLLLLDTIVQPNPVANGVVPNIIEPGKYEFEVVVSGENVPPQIKRWTLNFISEWKDKESEMLKSISLEEIDQDKYIRRPLWLRWINRVLLPTFAPSKGTFTTEIIR